MDDYHNEPTPWEDLGPTRQVQTYSPSSATAAKRLPSDDEIDKELLGCLTLVVPVGMDRQRRIEWVEVARATVAHVPLDLLREGCAHARKVADHPRMIVPAIIQATEAAVKSRRNMATTVIPRERRIEPQYVDPASARAILERHGLPVPEILKSKDTPS